MLHAKPHFCYSQILDRKYFPCVQWGWAARLMEYYHLWIIHQCCFKDKTCVKICMPLPQKDVSILQDKAHLDSLATAGWMIKRRFGTTLLFEVLIWAIKCQSCPLEYRCFAKKRNKASIGTSSGGSLSYILNNTEPHVLTVMKIVIIKLSQKCLCIISNFRVLS